MVKAFEAAGQVPTARSNPPRSATGNQRKTRSETTQYQVALRKKKYNRRQRKAHAAIIDQI
jgi:hypothetical protein